MYKILIGVIVGVTIALFNLFLRKYVEPIIPEKKKAISYIKKFFSFNLKYTVNIIFLILHFNNSEFNKKFILLTCVFFGIIFFNLTTDIIFMNISKQEKITDIHRKTIQNIAKEVEGKN